MSTVLSVKPGDQRKPRLRRLLPCLFGCGMHRDQIDRAPAADWPPSTKARHHGREIRPPDTVEHRLFAEAIEQADVPDIGRAAAESGQHP